MKDSVSHGLDHERAPSLPDELRLQLMGTLLDSVPGLVLVCRLSDLKVVFLNRTASKRLNPENVVDVAQLSLPELTSLASLQRLQGEILPQAQVLGRWSGVIEMRDGWGSEFKVTAVFTLQKQKPHNGENYLCMHAQESAAMGATDETHFTDRHLLHVLLNHSIDSIYFKDSFCRFLRISKAMAEKFGMDYASDAIGKTDFDIFSAQHASAAFADENKVMRTGEPILDLEEKETFEDGHVTWCSTCKYPLRDESGNVIGTFGISRDITAKKLAEQSQREMETQLHLAQKLESIGRLAAGVAHEINTPTQFITDNTRFLSEAFAKIDTVLARYRELSAIAADYPACAAAIQAAAAAEQAGEMEYLKTEIPYCLQQSRDGLTRVSRIVQSLKEYAHPNSPELTPSDLNRAIETALMISRHEWKYVAEVVTELAPDLPLVPCVVDEFNQAMLNLLVNAAHAIGEALKQRGEKQGRITVRTRLEETWAVVEVEDTGTGIPDEIRHRVFEPFFTTKALGKGTGQGLAFVHTIIVKHHHGTIELTSEPGRGSKFILRLPLVTPGPAVS